MPRLSAAPTTCAKRRKLSVQTDLDLFIDGASQPSWIGSPHTALLEKNRYSSANDLSPTVPSVTAVAVDRTLTERCASAKCSPGMHYQAGHTKAACNSCGRRAPTLTLARSPTELIVCPRYAIILVTVAFAVNLRCVRCKAVTCTICSRTCYGGSLPSIVKTASEVACLDISEQGFHATRTPLRASAMNIWTPHLTSNPVHQARRLKRRLSSQSSPAEDHESESQNRSSLGHPTCQTCDLDKAPRVRSGCGETFCRACVIEVPSRYR